MNVNAIQAKNILQKSGIPGIPYVINPYTGCTHRCVYCYARFMKRFTGHPEAWGTFLDAKINALELLARQLQRRKTPPPELVFLSSVTDPYLPEEAQYQLTRKILEVLLRYQIPLEILTKSDLVLRDLDLLRQFKQCSVGMSIMTTDDELAHRVEPCAAPPSRRIQALKTLKAEGLETYAFVSPYLPHLSDLERLIPALQGVISSFGVEALNVTGANWSGVARVLRHFYPDRLDACWQCVKDDTYWDVLEERARQLATQYGMAFTGLYRH